MFPARALPTTLVALILVALISACTGPAAQVTPTLYPSRTVAPTAAPSKTPAPEVTATITPSPHPTSLPEGLAALYSAGFSVMVPPSWQIAEKSGRHITIIDRAFKIVVVIESVIEENEELENFVETFHQELPEGSSFLGLKKDTVTLADGVKADRMRMVLQSDNPDQDLWLILGKHGKRRIHMIVFAPRDIIADRQGTLERVLESIALFDPVPFGLPRNDTLVMLGANAEEKYLDPSLTISSAADYVGLLFSGLVRLAPDLGIIPDLAEKWEIDPGGTVYTFTLREGVAFSNGLPITAANVKESWERTCDPATKSTTARTYLGDIVGVKEKLDGKADEVTGVEVVDDRTLRVTLDGPKPYFLAKLTYPVAFVFDAQQAQDNPEMWMFSPNSTGPFRLKSIIEDEGTLFERNPSYWQPAKVAYLAFLENPGGSALSLYEEGTLDLLGIGGKDLSAVSRDQHPVHSDLLITPSLCTQLIMFNPDLPPFDDLMVRKAVTLATNRNWLIEKLTEKTALLADTVLPPAMPGYQPGKLVSAEDTAAAKEALAGSKYAGQELKIRLAASGYADSQRDDVAILVSQWEKTLGVEVAVEYLDPEAFTQAARSQPANAMLYGWCADYPDPENFMDVLFHSDSEFNITGLKDAQIDAWLEQARTESLPEKRLALYRQVEERVLQQAYVLPLFHNVSGALVNPRVSGYTLSAGGAQVLHLVGIVSQEN